MMPRHRLATLAFALGVAVSLAHCGGSTAGASCAPTAHRAIARACAATPYPVPMGTPPTACATDGDCQASGSGLDHCLKGQCAFDECMVDGDCANGDACVCSTDYYGGNAAYHPNVCVPAECHVDSDCGAGGLCAPGIGYCGSNEGFHCVPASAQPCSSPNDTCNFAPEVGHFTCGTGPVCNG